jgi:hypothetical protein
VRGFLLQTGHAADRSFSTTDEVLGGFVPEQNLFWSVILYDLPQQLLVAHPINRYSVPASTLCTKFLAQIKKIRTGSG